MTPYAVSLIAVLTVAWLYHGITEHHWHRALWRLADPSVTVPPPRFTSRWHAMSHAGRAAVDLVLLAAAAVIGTAWRITPAVTVITLAVFVILAITAIAGRALSKSIGGRHPENWEED